MKLIIHNHTYLLWSLLPVLPLASALIVLEILHGDAGLLALETEPLFVETDSELRLLSGLLVYAAVGLFHLTVCLMVGIWAVVRLLHRPHRIVLRTIIVLALSLGACVLMGYTARQENLDGALFLTYRNICAVIHAAGLSSHFFPDNCTSSGVSLLAWIALLPLVAGILATGFTSALVSAGIETSENTDEADLKDTASRLRDAFQANVVILVTSTVTLSLFFKLPLSVLHGDAIQAFSLYGSAMTLFYGMIFTLTLLTIFAPARLLLLRTARIRGDDILSESLSDVLGVKDIRQRFLSFLLTLSPLLVGATSPLLEAFVGVL